MGAKIWVFAEVGVSEQAVTLWPLEASRFDSYNTHQICRSLLIGIGNRPFKSGNVGSSPICDALRSMSRPERVTRLERRIASMVQCGSPMER